MKTFLLLLIGLVVAPMAFAEFENVPTFRFEAGASSREEAEEKLAECRAALAQTKKNLLKRGARILAENECMKGTHEGDQIETSYSISGSILFL